MGAVVIGIGCGIVVRSRATTGGTDIVAMILQKYCHIRFSKAILLVDGMVVLFGLLVIDFIVEGLDKAKSVMIVTERQEEICQALSAEFGRGITQISARGYFSGAEKCVIYFVVNRFQIPRVKKLVTSMDGSEQHKG